MVAITVYQGGGAVNIKVVWFSLSFHKHVLVALSAGSKSGRGGVASWLCYFLTVTLGRMLNFQLHSV